ncbi:MAG: hypothetical protein AVDCRST_MAG52-66 [uncultured Blastococcus sp.]|uniref:Uncharacterized protein n=1 Tax=uncultured Blastococcus sp. TaxID=217144 RepID=A0A6J4H5J0_9ACTN|nr:MAG: hypothetical protein AVDCRST_MAG52-66 [uncultured Blastococcus sp.]
MIEQQVQADRPTHGVSGVHERPAGPPPLFERGIDGGQHAGGELAHGEGLPHDRVGAVAGQVPGQDVEIMLQTFGDIGPQGSR